MARGLYRVALGRARRVFFLNKEDRQLFLDLGLTTKQRACMVGAIGVNLDEFPATPIPPAPCVFLLAARLLQEKGIRDFVIAARKIKEDYPETRFILLGGPDPNPGSLRTAEVEAWVAEGVIEWPGQVGDVRPWLAQASVFVLPSYYREGVPRSIQEAMAMARPIITTDSVGCRDTVEPGRNGYLLPPRNPEALAAAMRQFILLPGLLERMGQESRIMAEARFDATAAAQRLLAEMRF
jgi:glycosyltransferase involved in cell wall biosynthesis